MSTIRMNKTSPFSKTTKQLRQDLARAIASTKAAYPGFQFAEPWDAANDPAVGEIEISQKSSCMAAS